MNNLLKTIGCVLWMTSVLLIVSGGVAMIYDAALAAKPGRCEPWPACKDDGDDNGSQILQGTLHFEPRNGLAGKGLLTDHGDDDFGYPQRMNLPGCQNTIEGEWFIQAQREIVDDTQIWTANGSDLVIDVVSQGQFNGCHGTSEDSNGILTLSLKNTGKRRNKVCNAKLDWQFDYSEAANQTVKYFSMNSVGWIPLTTSPFDQCDPSTLSSIELLGDFSFFSNVVENGVTTNEYIETETLDFFVVFHSCPGGTGC